MYECDCDTIFDQRYPQLGFNITLNYSLTFNSSQYLLKTDYRCLLKFEGDNSINATIILGQLLFQAYNIFLDYTKQ